MDDIRLRLLVQTIQLTLMQDIRTTYQRHLVLECHLQKTKGQEKQCKASQGQAGLQEDKKPVFPGPDNQHLEPHPPVCSLLPPPAIARSHRCHFSRFCPPPSDHPKMSFAVVGVMALMCSSVVIAFVLQPSKQKDVMLEDSNSRCHRDSLQSIRKELLAALNLQTEPRLPEGAREQWRGTAERLKAVTVSSSSSSDDGRDTSGCCTETSEVSMTELGWNNWMIYPERVTLVHCMHCGHSASCRPQPNTPQRDLQVQAPCCQPTTQEAVPVMYMDEWNTVVITSIHLTRRCGCPATLQPPQE